MAIASFYKPSDITANNNALRLSAAGIAELQLYNSAAYRRMDQVYKGDQDSVIMSQWFPKATIEILLMLEDAWWPMYVTKAAKTTLWSVNLTNGQLMTGFKPVCLVKSNQWLIELETFLVVSKFYESIISDNANRNEKDLFNYETAQQRFADRWSECMQASHFYDVNLDGFISKIEESNDMDMNYYSEDRRYF